MTIKLTILGCGGSSGVPMIGNRWGVCDPLEPKNRRTRCGVMVESEATRLLVDTGPDFREHMNRYGIHEVTAILYTHSHGDHVNGFEELRYVYKRERGLIPLYADRFSRLKIREKFPHMFDPHDTTGFYPLPIEFVGWREGEDLLRTHRIGDIDVRPIKLQHGPNIAIGYRFGDVAYLTDMNDLPEESYAQLAGVRTMIIDCNNMFDDKGLAIHLNFEGVERINARLQIPDVILTHLKITCDYQTDSARLPAGYRLAYDGMEIAI